MNIGRAIKLCRTQRGISQGDLAKRANCSLAGISQLETGKRNPTSVIDNIAKALGVPVGILFFLGAEEGDLRGIDKELQAELARTALMLLKNEYGKKDEIESA